MTVACSVVHALIELSVAHTTLQATMVSLVKKQDVASPGNFAHLLALSRKILSSLQQYVVFE